MTEISIQSPFLNASAPVAPFSWDFRGKAQASLNACGAALGAGGRALYARIPTAENARKTTLNLAIIALVILAIATVVKASVKRYVSIDAINVPRSVADRGLTGEVIAQRILDEIAEIGRVSKARLPLGEFSTFSFDRALPKIDLPVAGMSLSAVVGSLRDFLGLLDTKIAGEVVLNEDAPGNGKKKYWLRLRINDRGSVYRHPDPSDNLDELITAAALQVVERFDPHIAAAYYNAKGDHENALRMINSALSDGSAGNDAEALNLRGKIFQGQGRFDEALAQFRELRQRYPEFLEAQHNIAATLMMQFRFDEALEEARRGIELDPKRILSYMTAGSVLFSKQRFDEALSYFKRGAEAEPSEAVGYITQGSVYQLRPQPDYQKAIALYQRAADLDPRDARTFVNWGMIARTLNDHTLAQELFARAIIANPKSQYGYDLLGLVFLDDQKWDKAAEQFQKAIALNANDMDLRYHFAQAMRASGNLDEAARTLRDIIDRDGNYALAYTTLAVTRAEMLRQLRYNTAEETGAERDRAEEQARDILDEIRDLLDQAQEIAPTKGQVLREIGLTYETLGRDEIAVAAYRRAIAAAPKANANLDVVINRLGWRIVAQ